MNLQPLITMLDVTGLHGSADVSFSSVAVHSDSCGPGSLFVALTGQRADGHAYLDAAYRAGARIFVTQKHYVKPDATTVVVPDTQAALSLLAAELYRHPTRELTLAGITGTNGKTTTAFIMESIISRAGGRTGLISTIAYRYAGNQHDAERTTPNQLDLQKMFRSMADAHTTHAVMEVSSHGIDQNRVGCCHFDVCIFTNLSPEHLDYHNDMEHYYKAKARLFTDVLPASCKKNVAAVINRDDPAGARLIDEQPCRAVSFGRAAGDIHADRVRHSLDGIRAAVVTPDSRFEILSPLIGGFNLYNILAAAAAAWFLGIPSESIKKGIEAVSGIPGRMERIDNGLGIKVFIDYAHTADALENVLRALNESGASRIMTIFGCGGDRDRTKRPAMGSVAAAYSHSLILTSDNPRSESPERIIAEIRPGVEEKGFSYAENAAELMVIPRRYCVISDRRSAIRSGIKAARRGDVVLIAGKGHEAYQEIGPRRTRFDDRSEAREAIRMCA